MKYDMDFLTESSGRCLARFFRWRSQHAYSGEIPAVSDATHPRLQLALKRRDRHPQIGTCRLLSSTRLNKAEGKRASPYAGVADVRTRNI